MTLESGCEHTALRSANWVSNPTPYKLSAFLFHGKLGISYCPFMKKGAVNFFCLYCRCSAIRTGGGTGAGTGVPSLSLSQSAKANAAITTIKFSAFMICSFLSVDLFTP